MKNIYIKIGSIIFFTFCLSIVNAEERPKKKKKKIKIEKKDLIKYKKTVIELDKLRQGMKKDYSSLLLTMLEHPFSIYKYKELIEELNHYDGDYEKLMISEEEREIFKQIMTRLEMLSDDYAKSKVSIVKNGIGIEKFNLITEELNESADLKSRYNDITLLELELDETP